ncbi:MAG: CDP-alcohol phosphatidyltransferase family protein [Lachnospiraceae bacterium]|nr:CDP-alcohol phosphatidyltransferase family protein [Lachnospiraceae bacterium]
MMENKQLGRKNQEAAIFTVPNLLSFLRICLIPAIVWLYCVKQDGVLAGGVLILSGITDMVDGYIARKFHMTSSLGKVLDPVADKLTQGVMLICLFSHFPWLIVPIVIMVVKEIFMSVTGLMVIKQTGTVLGASWHGKIVTCLLYAIILVHFIWYDISKTVSIFLVVVCTLMILVSFLLYGIRNIKMLLKSRS